MKNNLLKINSLLLIVLSLGLVSCSFNTPDVNGGNSDSEPPVSSDTDTGGSSSDNKTTTYNTENSKAKEVTIKTLLNKGNTKDTTNLYRVTGVVQYPYNQNYGNFDLVDETGYITVYGLSKNASSMSYSGSNYSFTNDKSFRSIGVKAGDTITIEGIYEAYSYNSGYYKSEIMGYIISKTSGNVPAIKGENYTANEPYKGNYYDSVKNLTGNQLLKGLHNLMMDTHDTYVTYNSLNTTLKSSDPGNSSSQVKCFYSGKSTSSFNREHVWAQSLSGTTSSSSTNLYGQTHGGSDIHHIRPAIGSYNSLRSNAAFGIVYGPKSGMSTIPHTSGQNNYITGAIIEPVDAIKGDVARIVMYMYMHYSSSICNYGSTYEFLGTMNVWYVMGPESSTDCFKLLRKWNALDPVDDYERNRNEVGFNKQGNRNPFVDHPSYADAIWG
jgi:endonuclease I